MKKEIVYRKAVPSDSLRLSILFMAVYIQTYGEDGVSTEFANFISKQFSKERIEKTIKQFPDSIIVAVYEDNLVGVAEIEFDKQCPVRDIIAPELSKLYVLNWFYGLGVGYNLIREAEKTVFEKGEKNIWLSVFILNERAINFYERQKYEWIGNDFFQMEFNKYENKIMLKTLDF